MYYRVCELCGACLDPGEKCDCKSDREQFYRKSGHEARHYAEFMLQFSQPEAASKQRSKCQARADTTRAAAAAAVLHKKIPLPVCRPKAGKQKIALAVPNDYSILFFIIAFIGAHINSALHF